MNSLLHHLSRDATLALLGRAQELLAHDGQIHILELIRPAPGGLDSVLARLDRGQHSRPLNDWLDLASRYYDFDVIEPYGVGVGRLVLWNMVYLRGRAT